MKPELDAVLAKIRDAQIFHFQDIEIQDVFARSPSCGESLLHVVATWGDIDAARALLDEGVPVDIPGEDNCTPLYGAVEQHHPELVRLLIERGADPRKPSDMGTPYDLAILLGYSEIAEMMKDAQESRNASRNPL